MSQSCFSLGFLSQNSLWKLSTFNGYMGIYSRVYEECERSVFPKQSGLTTCPHDCIESQANYLAKLEVLSCSTPTSVTLQVPCMLHMCASFGDLPAASQTRDPIVRLPWIAHFLRFLHTLSHTTLTWFPPKYRVSKCWITSKLAWNKANKMVD